MINLPGHSSRITSVIFCAAGLLLGFAAFIPSIVAWFTAEELSGIYVVRIDVFAVWSGRGGPGFFRPVIPMLVWAMDQVFGMQPRPYHLLNVLLHLANSCLVYVVARDWARILPESHRLRSVVAAGTAALWFWVWPSHSEPVSWIPALTDVAAAVWALASLAAYLQYRNGGRWPWALGALLLYMGGLCTKESVITLPAVLFIYELMRAALCRSLRLRNFFWPGIFMLVMLGYFLLRKVLTGVFLGGYGSNVHTDFSWSRMQGVLAPNLANAFLPLPGLDVNQKYWTLFFFALLCAGGILWRSRTKAASISVVGTKSEDLPDCSNRNELLLIGAMAAASIIIFLPGLNLGPGVLIDGQRFAYLASAFAVSSLAYTAVYVLPRGRTLCIFVWVVAIACSALLATYNRSWYRAGKVARQAVRGMEKLPPARRLYVLTTTGSYREAPILPHNLGLISTITLKKPREGEIVIAGIVRNWAPETAVIVEKTNRNNAVGFIVRLQFPDNPSEPSPRLEALGGPSEQWAVIAKEGDTLYVEPKDFDPALDKVVWLNGGEWKIAS